MLAFVSLTTSARAAGTVTVKPSDTGGWAVVQEGATAGAIEFVDGPGGVPLGAGSARFTTDSTTDGPALGALLYAGVALADVTTLEYSTYVDPASPGAVQAVALQLNFDDDVTDADTSWKGRLVFEPYQTPGNVVTKGIWQTWDTLAGNWWATGAPASTECPQSAPCDIATLLGHYPDAGFNSSFGGLLLKAGSGWSGFDGAADAIVINVSGDETTYDFEPETACTTVCYVDAATGDDSFGGDSPGSAKATLQAALAAVDDGGTISMADGTYDEVGQIVIDKTVSIEGEGAATVIRPTANTVSSNSDARGWFLVTPGAVLHLSEVSLDGNELLIWQALRVRGSGSMTNVNVTDIRFQEAGGPYAGTGVAAFGDGTFDVTSSTFSEIGRIGVHYFGTGVSGSVYSGNVYTGKGDGDWLDYGVEVGAGAVVTIEDSTFSDNRGVADSDGSTSAGILVTTFFGPGSAATITGNTIVDSTTGIYVGFDETDTSEVEANFNNITGNETGVRSTAPVVDATCNWWGDASGPGGAGPGSGDGVDGPVDFAPWLTAPAPAGPCNGGLSNSDCMQGGWQDLGFVNQGRCIQFIKTGIDSR